MPNTLNNEILTDEVYVLSYATEENLRNSEGYKALRDIRHMVYRLPGNLRWSALYFCTNDGTALSRVIGASRRNAQFRAVA